MKDCNVLPEALRLPIVPWDSEVAEFMSNGKGLSGFAGDCSIDADCSRTLYLQNPAIESVCSVNFVEKNLELLDDLARSDRGGRQAKFMEEGLGVEGRGPFGACEGQSAQVAPSLFFLVLLRSSKLL